jgi:predicted transcriptional regulator of viral defense system
MNRKLLESLIHWPKSFLTYTEIILLLNKNTNSCDAVIRRAIKAGYLQRLIRGLYLITSKVGASRPDSREVAQFIYGPSYISFEAALSWHGWIPEGVRVTTSAAVKRSKEFSTSIGLFTYERIPTEVFALGVRHIKTSSGSFLMADGWKALADIIYTRNNCWSCIEDIYEDLRIEKEDLVNSNLELLKELASLYPNKCTRYYLNLYYQELK